MAIVRTLTGKSDEDVINSPLEISSYICTFEYRFATIFLATITLRSQSAVSV